MGVSDWFVIMVTASSCTKSCVVSCGFQSQLFRMNFFLSVSENIIYFSMYLKKICDSSNSRGNISIG